MYRILAVALASGSILLSGIGLTGGLPTFLHLPSVPAGAQAAPIGEIDIWNSGYPIERSACLSVSLGQDAATECGNLRVVHALPSVRVFDTEVQPTLIYNSEFAHPYWTIPVNITQLSTTNQADSVDVELWVGAFGATKTLRARAAWAGSEWPAGVTTKRRVAIRHDALGDTTGVYAYEVVVGNWYGGTRLQHAYKPAGGYHHVNRSNSPYGAGWWLAGHEQIKKYYQSGGTTAMLWVGGDGSTRTFTVGLVHYYERLDSLTYNAGTQRYVRKLPGGRSTEFDLTGRHVRTVNRFGRITSFAYLGSTPVLDSIALPAPTGLGYRFGYTSNKLTSVTAPRLSPSITRVTTLVNSSGNVTQIRNAGDSVVAFAYHSVAPHQYIMQQRSSRKGTPMSFTYDSALKVRSSSVTPGYGGNVITSMVTAGESRGLPRSGTPSSADTGKVYTHIDGPRSVPDTTVLFQGRFGTVRRVVDARGATTHVRPQVSYDGFDMAWLTTRIKKPLGQVLLYEWDDRGNVMREIDSTGTNGGVRDTTQYVYDGTFDQLTRVIPPEKDSLMFGVNGTNGRREWQQDVRGAASQVSFTYGNASYPEEVTGVVLPAVNGQTATYTYAYHATTRNAVSEQTPLGFVTTWTQDAIGRDILMESPIDSITSSTRKVRQRFTYSLRGDVTQQASATANVTPAESLLVTTIYDADGLSVSVQRSMLPDPGSIGTMTTTWRRDNIGRTIAVQAPDGFVDSTVYNEIGKPITSVSRRHNPGDPGSAQPVTVVYDVMGRDSIRTVPSLAYAARNQGIPTRHFVYGLDSAYRAITIPTVADTFLYDAEGRVTSARNRYARITRTYKRNGRDSTELQGLATLGGTFGTHDYLIAHTYDRNGRRTKLAVPSQLVPTAKDTIRFAYGTWGQDSLVTDPDGNSYRYTYTTRAEPSKLEYLAANVTRYWGYDADGRLVHDSTVNGGTTFPRWSHPVLRRVRHWYDGRGKILQRADGVVFKDTLRAKYSGLGTLLSSRHTQNGTYQLWGSHQYARTATRDTMVADPLGNVVDGWTWDTTQVSGSLPVGAPPLPRPSKYVAGVGRLDTLGAAIPGKRAFLYDSAGSEAFSTLRGDAGGNNPSADRASYYDAAGRLAAAEYRTVTSEANVSLGFTNSIEKYRYDPFGRRVWVRAGRWCDFVPAGVPEATGYSIECSRSFVRRVVWDGPRELAEIQMPDDASNRELDTGHHTGLPLVNGKDPNPFYGRVVYTPGRTIDQPLALYRLGYADWPITGSYTTWTPFLVTPLWDATGEAHIGMTGTGDAVRQLTPGGTACATGTSPQRCVKLYWPESFSPYDRLRGVTPVAYMGAVLDGRRTTTGTQDQRARVYDPKTGRFTQEDPIGLAGGLNLYGYATGDPVNFSDPFGLTRCDKQKEQCPSLVDRINTAMASAAGNLATAALAIGAGAVNAVTGLGDLFTSTGLNPAEQSTGGRAAAGAAFVAGLADPSPGLQRGIQKTIKLAQGSEVSFRQLGRFTQATWEVAGDKGAGYVRWNKVLSGEGGTMRLYKDVYNQGGNFLRRDWYVGGPK